MATTSRTVLISGGGTGIGRAVAAAFAADGATVYITGRREAPLLEAAAAIDGDVTSIVCDHGDPAALERLAAALPERLDVLVNNAGGVGRTDTPGLAGVAESWRANLDANVLTAVLTTEALAGRLAEGGTVVHFGSIGAEKGNVYGAAKAALAAWNVGLARTLGPRGVTANVISPGYIEGTDFFDDEHNRMTPERYASLVDATMLGRAGTVDDIAGTVLFLASPGARYLTGQVVNVNGGAFTTR